MRKPAWKSIAVAVALLSIAAACGSSTTSAPAAPSAGATAAPSPTGDAPDVPTPAPVEIRVADTAFGQILTDGTDRTLYVYLLDDGRDLACVDTCLEAWAPVMIEGDPKLPKGLRPEVFGAVKREGIPQLTIGGQAAYTFSGDAPGDISGQGAESLWYIVTPEGARITTIDPT